MSLLLPGRAALRSQLSQGQEHRLLGYILIGEFKQPGAVPQPQADGLPLGVISTSPARLAASKQPAGHSPWPLVNPKLSQGLRGQHWWPRPKQSSVSAANLTVRVNKFRALNLQTCTFRIFISTDVTSVFSMGKEREQEKLLAYLHKLLCHLPQMLPTNTLTWLEFV